MGPESQLVLAKVLVIMCYMFVLFYPLFVSGVVMSPGLLHVTFPHDVHLHLQVLTTIYRGMLVLLFSYSEHLFTVDLFKASTMDVSLFVSVDSFSCL